MLFAIAVLVTLGLAALGMLNTAALIGTPKVGCAAPLRGNGRRPSGKS
jgi:hypothetical protein